MLDLTAHHGPAPAELPPHPLDALDTLGAAGTAGAASAAAGTGQTPLPPRFPGGRWVAHEPCAAPYRNPPALATLQLAA